MRTTPAVILTGLVIAAICIITPLTLGNGYFPWAPAPQQAITGNVSCRSGRPVEGIWVAEATGLGLFAPWNRPPARPADAAYHAAIPARVAYLLHVGCGGSAQTWLVSAASPSTTMTALSVVCDDIAADPAYNTCSITAGR